MNKLLDQYNNTYHHSLNANYSAFTEKIETNPQGPKFKANERVRITEYNNIFSKGYTGNWSREISIIDSVLKTNIWTCKIKDLIGGKTIGSFYEKELLLSKFK